MKKLLAVAVLMIAAGATAAGSFHRKVTDEEVNRAIDERLHELLVKLNAEKK